MKVDRHYKADARSWILPLVLGIVLVPTTTAHSEPAIPEKPVHFRSVGKLNFVYNPGSFVALRSCKILAIGGVQLSDGQTPEKNFSAEDGKTYGFGIGMTELFDPKTGTTKVITQLPYGIWQRTIPVPYRQIRSIELKDGRILIVGFFVGERTNPPSDLFALVYDLTRHTVVEVKCPQGISPRHMATLHLLRSGKVLILGGASDPRLDVAWKKRESDVLLFDPENNHLSVTGALQHARYGHESLEISDSKFLLFGGWGPSDAEAKEKVCRQFDQAGKCISESEKMHTVEVEEFNLKNGLSRIVGHTLLPRYDFSALQLPNRRILILGGPRFNQSSNRAAELYDPQTGKTELVGDPLGEESVADNAFDKTPYFFGGGSLYFRAAILKDFIVSVGAMAARIYEAPLVSPVPASSPSTLDRPVVSRRNHHVLVTYDKRLFVIGGEPSPNGAVIEEFQESEPKASRRGI